MAPRRRAARRKQDQPGANEASIGCLPLELLLAVFGQVPLAERHRSLVLVCRQWTELVHSPTLLSSVNVVLGPASLLPDLRSLVEWLARRALGHVQHLQLSLSAGGYYAAALPEEANQQEATASIVAAVTLLAGSLRELSLSTRNLALPPLGAWLAPLAGLTSLEMGCNSDDVPLIVSIPLSFLSGLRSLRLHAPKGEVLVQPWAALPPRLTRLWMRSYRAGVPTKLAALSCLRELTIIGATDAEGFSALVPLRSTLTALNVTVLDDVPDCLSRLTGLRSLTIDDSEGSLAEPDDKVLEQALPQMKHLTAVYLFSGGLPDTPAALSSLCHLDTVCWSGWNRKPMPLPGGPWLARLRRLTISAHFLSDAASLAKLSGAQRLERLGVDDIIKCSDNYSSPRAPPHSWFVRDAEVVRAVGWAGRHASLQLLVLSELSPRLARAAAAAQRARPQLCIQQADDVHKVVCGYEREEHGFSDDDDDEAA